jgi:hypothetical protein
MGKRDSRTYAQSLDATLTHSLIYIQSIAHAGQHRVNKEFLDLISQQVSALAAQKETHESLSDRITDSKMQQKTLKGRPLDRERAVESELQGRKRDVLSQAATNSQRIELSHVQAQQALDSWVTYYEHLASIYIRYRIRIKGTAAPTDAGVPQFDSLPLSDVEIELSKVKIP